MEKAVASYHKSLAINPDYAETHFNLGNALQDLGQMENAVVSYHKSLASNPIMLTHIIAPWLCAFWPGKIG